MIKILRKIDKPLFFTTIFMFIFGLIMICSASYVKAIMALDNAYYYLIRQSIILVVCLLVFLFGIVIPTSLYSKFYNTILYASIGLLLLLLPFGIVVNGAKSWLPFPVFNFQPAEFAKIAVILYMAYYYDKNKNNKDDYKVALKPFIYIFIIFGLITIQPDLGSAIILFGLAFAIFIAVPLYPKVKSKTRRSM